MEITISQFRNNIKDYFDAALNGEPMCIDRGGVHFNLVPRLPYEKISSTKDTVDITPSITHPAPVKHPNVTIVSSSDVLQSKENFDKGNIFQLKAVKTSDPTKQALCKIHGVALDFRGRCLQKGCKYA